MGKSQKSSKKKKIMNVMNERIHELVDDVEPSKLVQYLNDFIIPDELLKGSDQAYSGLSIRQYLTLKTFFKALDGDEESIRTILMLSSEKKDNERPKEMDLNSLYR